MTQSDTTNTQGKGDSPSNPYEAAKAKFAQETSQFEDRRALELNGITPTDKVVMTGKYPAHTGKMDIDFVSPPQGLPIDEVNKLLIDFLSGTDVENAYAALTTLIAERERLAYKKGFADGAISSPLSDNSRGDYYGDKGEATDPADV